MTSRCAWIIVRMFAEVLDDDEGIAVVGGQSLPAA